MIVFKIKELLEKNDVTRYKFQQLTKWNYKRINAYYFGEAKLVTIDELETICKLFNCKISDIIEFKK